jgi:hypothetical protein
MFYVRNRNPHMTQHTQQTQQIERVQYVVPVTSDLGGRYSAGTAGCKYVRKDMRYSTTALY